MLPAASLSTTSQPGMGRPMEPGLGSMHGSVAICSVVSVWPYPSWMGSPVAAFQSWNTLSFSSSPAVVQWRSFERSKADRSCRTRKRYTVGGAQKVVTAWSASTPSRAAGSNLPRKS